jgi:hypothetical protein
MDLVSGFVLRKPPTMGQVIPLKGKRLFTLREARGLLPIVKRVTAEAIQRSERLMFQMEMLEKGNARRAALEVQLNGLIEEWVRKVERLGCEAKGLWLVDFDSGSGYYCWHHGESNIAFFHGYAEGFAGRRPLTAVASEEAPVRI